MAIINKNQLKVNHISGFKLKKVIRNGIINIDNLVNTVYQFHPAVIAVIFLAFIIPAAYLFLMWIASHGVQA